MTGFVLFANRYCLVCGKVYTRPACFLVARLWEKKKKKKLCSLTSSKYLPKKDLMIINDQIGLVNT